MGYFKNWTSRCALAFAVSTIIGFGGALQSAGAQAEEPAPGAHSEHGSLAEVGAKLANPVSDVWALFTEFGLNFSDGDLNKGDPLIAGNLSFQPILPVPLYGSGAKEWKLIVRPTIPLIMGGGIPRGFNDFDSQTGLGDTLFPLPIAAPTGNWLLALGPTFKFPTSTVDAFGEQQWAAGPTGVFGYKSKNWVAVVFPQYFFGIGSRGDQGSKPDTSNMGLLYSFFYNLPNAWQIGFNPTVTYNSHATSGNHWNVPVGLVGAKTTSIGGRPWKFQFGMEYSVVSQDDFGQRAHFKVNMIPVISPLIGKSIFGGA